MDIEHNHFFNIDMSLSDIKPGDYGICVEQPEGVPDDEFLYDDFDASIYTGGLCYIFAQALHDEFGYVMKKGKDDTHYFCTCLFENKTYYIDARGATADRTIFFSGRFSCINPDELVIYEGWSKDEPEPSELYDFAARIISDIKLRRYYSVN